MSKRQNDESTSMNTSSSKRSRKDFPQQIFPNQLQQAEYDYDQDGLREWDDIKTAPSSTVNSPTLTYVMSPQSPSELELDTKSTDISFNRDTQLFTDKSHDEGCPMRTFSLSMSDYDESDESDTIKSF